MMGLIRMREAGEDFVQLSPTKCFISNSGVKFPNSKLRHLSAYLLLSFVLVWLEGISILFNFCHLSMQIKKGRGNGIIGL